MNRALLLSASITAMSACSRCGAAPPLRDVPAPVSSASSAPSSQLTTTTSSSPCFTVVAPRATARTRAVFAEHDLHGGGPTWGAILQATALRHGRDVRELEDPPPDYPGFGAPFAITTGAGVSWYTVDDESDAAVFCTPDTTLRAAVRRDVERADVDEAARETAIAEAAAFGEE